jgi:hypothetical protein
MAGMVAWRCVIIAISLCQAALGVACWCLALSPEIGPEVGRFGLAACLAVGALGLIGQGTAFLRPAAIGANALFAAVFVPGLLGRVTIRVLVWTVPGSIPPDVYTGIDADLFAAGAVLGGAASALGMWRLWGGRGRGPAEPSATPDSARDIDSESS